SNRQATDRAGRRVVVGTRVRVLEVDVALKTLILADEWQELQAMVGGTFKVYEIDEHGSVWVETFLFFHVDGYIYSHSFAFDAHEMEVVSESRRCPTRG